MFDWESTLTDVDVNEQVSIFNNALTDVDVNEQVSIFNERITNIMSYYLPNEIIICESRDPPWMSRHIKYLILYNANFYKTFVRKKNSMFYLLTFHNLQNHLNQFKSIYSES